MLIKPILKPKHAMHLILLLFTSLNPALANQPHTDAVISNGKSINDQIVECKKLEDQDPAAAIKLGEQLLFELNSQNKPLLVGHIMGCLGWAQVTLNELEKARINASEIEQVINDLDVASIDSIQLGRRAGGIFHRMGDRISASENYNRAMQQATDLNVVSEQIPILVNLGVLNSELREHEQAIENYYLALDLMKQHDDYRYRPPVLFNLAATLNGQKRYSEGLKLFQQVEEMITDQWPPSRISQTYHGLAAAHLGLGNLSAAKDYAEKGLAILADSKQINASYYSLKAILASIYSQTGHSEKAKTLANEAKNYFLDPANKADVLGNTNQLPNLAATYERLDLLSEALLVLKASATLETEMQDSFNQEVMAQMQARLNDSQKQAAMALVENEKINNQITLKEAEYKRQTWMLLSVVAVIIFLVFLFWQYVTNRKLKTMALTDSLTHLGNRRAVKHWLTSRKMPTAPNIRHLWLLDLDDFKAINDDYDHDVGDTVLQQLANALSQLNNAHRMISRWGGEEFVILTDDLSADDKDHFSQLLLDTIANTDINAGGGLTLNLTASVGISHLLDNNPSAWTRALYQADKALSTAKSRGKNCAVSATDHS